MERLLATTEAYESGLSEKEMKEKNIKSLSEAYHLKNGLNMIVSSLAHFLAGQVLGNAGLIRHSAGVLRDDVHEFPVEVHPYPRG